MLFNSYVFIFIFLPIVFTVYFFILRNMNMTIKIYWLTGASLFFYGYWNPSYLFLILVSIIVNFIVNKLLYRYEENKKLILVLGLIFNVGLLGYYKYSNFFIDNINCFFGTSILIEQIVLPLAISFFTFQQIAFIVDSYRGTNKDHRFADHLLFVTFFPQLIAGPIVHHHEVIPQFHEEKNGRIQIKNISLGIYIFIIGLAKKVLIADNFAILVRNGFDTDGTLMFFSSWITSLAYTFQLYFDFSGYCDMAMGAALLFNIRLPINFNSPYKALDIADFWRRWHMTLNRFLTHYVYIPLGGSRVGKYRTYMNLFIVFFISGIWHGAGWTFIIWGILHGLAVICNRLWKNTGFKLPVWLAWSITFLFVNAAWVFFRANDIQQAVSILKGMVGLNGVEFPRIVSFLSEKLAINLEGYGILLYDTLHIARHLGVIIVFFAIIIFAKNSVQQMDEFKINIGKVVFLSLITVASILSLSKVSEFLYFNF